MRRFFFFQSWERVGPDSSWLFRFFKSLWDFQPRGSSSCLVGNIPPPQLSQMVSEVSPRLCTIQMQVKSLSPESSSRRMKGVSDVHLVAVLNEVLQQLEKLTKRQIVPLLGSLTFFAHPPVFT